MGTLNRLRYTFTSLVLAACCIPACRADAIYHVTMNTSPLIGDAAGPFSLVFELTDGSGAGDANNTVVVNNFELGVGGSASGSPSVSGGATGDLLSGVTLIDSSFLNYLVAPFTPGDTLGFSVDATTNVDAGPTPDELSFSILDNTGSPLPTTGFVNAFLVLDINSTSPTPQTFASDPSIAPAGGGSGITMNAPQAPFATPEPDTFILLCTGFGMIYTSHTQRNVFRGTGSSARLALTIRAI